MPDWGSITVSASTHLIFRYYLPLKDRKYHRPSFCASPVVKELTEFKTTSKVKGKNKPQFPRSLFKLAAISMTLALYSNNRLQSFQRTTAAIFLMPDSYTLTRLSLYALTMRSSWSVFTSSLPGDHLLLPRGLSEVRILTWRSYASSPLSLYCTRLPGGHPCTSSTWPVLAVHSYLAVICFFHTV